MRGHYKRSGYSAAVIKIALKTDFSKPSIQNRYESVNQVIKVYTVSSTRVNYVLTYHIHNLY